MTSRTLLFGCLFLVAGCGEKNEPEPEPVAEYVYAVSMPAFMMPEPLPGQGQLVWAWPSRDLLISVSHLHAIHPGEVFDDPKMLAAILDEIGIVLKSDFVETRPGRLDYENRGKRGWDFIRAEKMPDGRCAIGMFGVYPRATPEMTSPEKAESIFKALKAGGFVEEPDQSRVTAEIHDK